MPVVARRAADPLRRGRVPRWGGAPGAWPSWAWAEWRHAAAIFGACAFAAWGARAARLPAHHGARGARFLLDGRRAQGLGARARAHGRRWRGAPSSSSTRCCAFRCPAAPSSGSDRARDAPEPRPRLPGRARPRACSGTASSAAWSARWSACCRAWGRSPGSACCCPRPTASTPRARSSCSAGIYYGAMYGGSTTSILMRIPGEAASVMTCIDGYAMARKGRAGPALDDRRGRLVRRRDGERGRAHVAGPAARLVRAALRPARVLRAAAAGPARPRVHEHRLDAEGPRHGGARAAARHDRHRPDERLLPLRVRRSPSWATASAWCRWRSGSSGSPRSC